MTKPQKIVLLMGVLAFVGSLFLFPPWRFWPPGVVDITMIFTSLFLSVASPRILLTLYFPLLIRWVVIGTLTGGLVVILRKRKP